MIKQWLWRNGFTCDNPKKGNKIHLNIGDARELLLGEMLLFYKV